MTDLQILFELSAGVFCPGTRPGPINRTIPSVSAENPLLSPIPSPAPFLRTEHYLLARAHYVELVQLSCVGPS